MRGIGQTRREVLVRDLRCDRLRCANKHRLRHAVRLRGEDGHAHRGKDVDVVPLAWDERPAPKLNRRERGATRENRPAIRPLIRLFRRALGTRSGVRVGKDIRALVEARHCLDDRLTEEFWHRAHADDAGGSDRLDRFQKGSHGRVLVSEWSLKIPHVRTGRNHEAINAEEPVARPALFHREAFERHRLADQLRDPRGRGTAAQEQDSLIGEFLFRGAQRAKDAGDRCRGPRVPRARAQSASRACRSREAADLRCRWRGAPRG